MRASAKENQTIVDNKNTDNNGIGQDETKTHNIFDVTVDQQSGYALGKQKQAETPPCTSYTLSGTTFETRKIGDYSKANVTVDVLDANGNVIKSALSDKNGDYSISGLSAGSYTVRFTSGSIVKTTTASINANTDLDMGFSPVVLNTNSVTTGAVIGNVWNDVNGNKLADDDSGVVGVRVSLVRFVNGKSEIISTTTDTDGNYRFDNVATGGWTVCVSKQNGFSFASGGNSDVSSIGAKSISITAGNVVEVNAAMMQAAKVSGTVFADLNGNGVQDVGETGKAGVLVYVTDSVGYSMGATSTDAKGNYSIGGLTAGNATVMFGSKALFTTANAAKVTLIAGKDVDVDAGMKQTVSVTGTLFHDVNGNGVRDVGETNASYKALYFTSTSGLSQLVFTDSKGNYNLSNVSSGKYTVSYFIKDGTVVTGETVINATELKNFRDLGVVKYHSLTGTIWTDKDADAIWDSDETGRAGVAVHAVNSAGKVVADAVTNTAGQYTFDQLLDGTYKILVDAASNQAISYQQDLTYRVTDLVKNIGITDLLSKDASLNSLLGDTAAVATSGSFTQDSGSAVGGALGQLSKELTSLNTELMG